MDTAEMEANSRIKTETKDTPLAVVAADTAEMAAVSKLPLIETLVRQDMAAAGTVQTAAHLYMPAAAVAAAGTDQMDMGAMVTMAAVVAAADMVPEEMLQPDQIP